MRLIGLKIPRSQTKALRLRRSVDHIVSQQQEKSEIGRSLLRGEFPFDDCSKERETVRYEFSYRTVLAFDMRKYLIIKLLRSNSTVGTQSVL